MRMKMKANACAIALGACALGAQAQDSVQMYGVVDLGLVYANNVRASAATPAENVLRLDSGNAFPSRLGFRGRESLGGGLSAVFNMEGGFSADSGVFTSRFFSRASYVGLAGPWGELQLGREVTATHEFALSFDPEGPSRFSTPTLDPAYAGRADNALKYVGRFGSLYIAGQYSLGFDSTVTNGGEQPAFRVGKEAGAYAMYDAGFARFGAAIDRQNGTSVATQTDQTDRVNLGATFAVGTSKVYLALARQTAKVGGISRTTKRYWIGADFKPTPALTLTPALYVNDPEGASTRSQMAVVRALYDLSKRTALYAEVGHMRNQAAANLALVGPVIPGSTQSGASLGVVHRF